MALLANVLCVCLVLWLAEGASLQDTCKLSIDNILGHLQELDVIAQVNSGNRAAGTSGYSESVGYISSVLSSQTDYAVSLQTFTFPTFEIIGTPRLTQIAPITKDFVYPTEFRVMQGSGSSSVSGFAVSVKNHGCDDADYSDFPGGIAIILRGICTFTEKAAMAKKYGASAAIVYNNNEGPVFSGSCESDIAVYGVSAATGYTLIGSNIQLIVDLTTKKEVSTTTNVIAETKTGDPTRVVLIGSHLDSVTGGAGINDNGSGSATNLEMALEFSRCLPTPTNKIRFAWWGAEEIGLLGSQHYVNDLVQNNPEELKRIALNINIDMLGSPNFFFGIYDGSGADPIIREKCIEIQKEFEGFMHSRGKPFSLTPFDGRSDYGPFIEVGVPAGGLFSGAEVVKDADGRTKFGGLANTPYDPCYHDYCDTYENVSRESLETLSAAAFSVAHSYATRPPAQLQPKHAPLTGRRTMYPQHPDALGRY